MCREQPALSIGSSTFKVKLDSHDVKTRDWLLSEQANSPADELTVMNMFVESSQSRLVTTADQSQSSQCIFTQWTKSRCH